MALRFWRALRALVLYGAEARKVQKIIGDTVRRRIHTRAAQFYQEPKLGAKTYFSCVLRRSQTRAKILYFFWLEK